CGCLFGCQCHDGGRCGDDGNLPARQFDRQRRQSIYLVIGPAIFERYVLTVDIATLFQALAEPTQKTLSRARRSGVEYPDYRHCQLLRTRGERPRCRRAAEQCDELAPLHSITSSARASSVGGTSRPSARAVLRLMTNSYLVGACTGRSAGFSPL